MVREVCGETESQDTREYGAWHLSLKENSQVGGQLKHPGQQGEERGQQRIPVQGWMCPHEASGPRERSLLETS